MVPTSLPCGRRSEPLNAVRNSAPARDRCRGVGIRVSSRVAEPGQLNLRPLRPELPATATMFATEHARAAPKPSGWRVAVVVLRYFVAVRLAGHLAFEHQLQRGLSTCVRFTVNV